MKLNLLHILCAILRCWSGFDLDNILFLDELHVKCKNFKSIE